MKTFLQTKEWMDFQKSLGREVFKYETDSIKAWIIKYDSAFGKDYLYIPHGPEIKFDELEGGLKNELVAFINYLKKIGEESKSIFVKIEPLKDSVVELLYGMSGSHRIKKSKKEIQPSKTVVINLKASEEELLSLMHHKTRYNIKVAEKNELTFVEEDNFEAFWKLLKQTSEKDKFYTHERDYYVKLLDYFKSGDMQARTYFIKKDNAYLSGMIMLTYGDSVYYLHGAMDRDYKSMMAPYLMHWEAMKLFKSRGFMFYDFWGIDSKKWPGVTRFKLGWGGNQIEYPGSFDLPISKFWYSVYKFARKFKSG